MPIFETRQQSARTSSEQQEKPENMIKKKELDFWLNDWSKTIGYTKQGESNPSHLVVYRTVFHVTAKTWESNPQQPWLCIVLFQVAAKQLESNPQQLGGESFCFPVDSQNRLGVPNFGSTSRLLGIWSQRATDARWSLCLKQSIKHFKLV